MKDLKTVAKKALNDVRRSIQQNTKESLLWLQASRQDEDDMWINESVTIDQIVNCTDDNVFHNVWVKLEEGSAEELDSFIEEQLIPNGLRILQETEKQSSNGSAVRFMIARPMNK